MLLDPQPQLAKSLAISKNGLGRFLRGQVSNSNNNDFPKDHQNITT
jgi:hypothetical protein